MHKNTKNKKNRKEELGFFLNFYSVYRFDKILSGSSKFLVGFGFGVVEDDFVDVSLKISSK